MTEHRISLEAIAKNYRNGGHSIFAPSSASMYLKCSGSLIANLLAPDDSGIDAAYGTVGHGVGELWLRERRKPVHLLGVEEWVFNGGQVYEIVIDEVMMEHVQRYVDWCMWLDGAHFVEQRVYFSEYTPIPKQGGTADHVACTYQRMTITDLKLGKGVQVFAENNPQLQLYALGFFLEWDWLYDFQTIEIRVAQPRINHFDVWVISRAQLLAFADEFSIGAHAAWDLDAPRTPSEDACRFCKVSATCAANAVLQHDLAFGDVEQIGKPITHKRMMALRDEMREELTEYRMVFAKHATLTIEEMAKMLKYRSAADAWWKKLAEQLLQRASGGEQVPGYKLVEGKSNRVWKSNAKARALLLKHGVAIDDIETKQLVSPAQAEDLLRAQGLKGESIQKALEPEVRKPAGKPTLAVLSDKREPLVDLGAEAFADLIPTTRENPTPETEEI